MFHFIAPLMSLFFFMLGNGFFPSLLALKLNLTPASDFVIGAMTGVFYLGLVVGSFYIEKMICRIGHVRAYVVFASVLSIMMALCGMTGDISLLLLFRFISGLGTAGVYVVIESWLLSQSSSVTRGRVLAFYMIVFYLAHAFGQLLLNLGAADDLFLFVLVSILCSLSVLPVALSKVQIPQPTEESSMGFMSLCRKATVGMLACFVSGAMMAAFYGLGPIFISDMLHKKSDVAFLMFSFVFGGMLFQYPVGKLSEYISKRRLLGILNVALIVVICLSRLLHVHYWLFVMMTGSMGGLILSMYPVAISAVCDAIGKEEIIQATQNLLVVFSMGAVGGPLVAALFTRRFGPWGIYVFLLTMSLFFLCCLCYKKTEKLSDSLRMT